MIGFGKMIASGIIAANPTNHIHGAIAAIARPPSSGTTGSRLNRFRKKPVNASARQRSLPVACQTSDAGGRADAAEDRAGESDARLGERVVAERPSADHRAQERDEHRRAGLDALAPQRDHVTHLVHEQQHDEAGRERPAPRRSVGGERDQHRARGGQQLQLRQQQQDRLELREERDDRGEDRSEPALEPGLLARLGRRGEFRPAVVAPAAPDRAAAPAPAPATIRDSIPSVLILTGRLAVPDGLTRLFGSGRVRAAFAAQRAGADFGRRVASRFTRGTPGGGRGPSVFRWPRREAGRETRLLVVFRDQPLGLCHTPLATGRSYTLTQYITPGDDWLRRGRIVGVVASRGSGRPRKTPGKP